MALVTDERAQSIQIGAVLIFGVLIIFLSIWQAFVVPNQNEEIEFDHNQEVQQELTELRGVVNSMPDAESTRSTAVTLGVRYPSRAIFVNPGPTSGTLRTVGTTDESVNVTFANVTAEGNVGDFWDDPDPYNTGFLSYEPNYNLYGNAPETVFENSVLYNDFGDSDGDRNALPLTGQSLVDGDRITIVTLNGSFSAGRTGTTSVDVRPVSTRTRTVDIEGAGGPVTVRIPTRLDNGTWEDILEEEAELVDQGGNVERVADGPGETVELVLRELPADESYSLRLVKVGLGTRVTGTDAAYLTDVAGDETTVGTDEARDVTVEVRDAFNGPVRDRLVNASAARGTLTTSRPRSGGDGRVTFRYRAPSSAGTDRLNFTIAEGVGSGDVDGEFRAGTPENVTMTVDVSETATEDPTTYDLRFDREQSVAESSGLRAGNDGEVVLNLDASSSATLVTETFDPAVEDATVDYATTTDDIATSFGAGSVTTGTDGTARDTLTVDNPDSVSDGEAVEVVASSGGNSERLTVVFERGAFFDVSIQNLDNSVVEGESLSATVQVENTGSSEDTQDLTFEIVDADGNVVFTDTVSAITLGAGEVTQETFEWQTEAGDAGDYEAVTSTDDDTATRSVTVSTADSAVFEVRNFDAPGSAVQGETIEISADVENTGGQEDTKTVEYVFGGTAERSQQLTLAPGEVTTVTFTYTIPDGQSPGDYAHEIASPDDSAGGTITVEEAPAIEGGFIVDSSSEGQGASSTAEFTLETLNVTNPDQVATFNITFDNQDGSAFDPFEANSVGGLEGSNHSPSPGAADFGDAYVITITLEDEAGDTIDQVVLNVEANGTDISL